MSSSKLLSSILLLVIGAAGGVWLDRSSTSWGGTDERQSPVPNVDFGLMAIATRPVMATRYGTTSKVRIKAWQRCALGYATCEGKRRMAQAICLGDGGTLLIDEQDWPAFQRIRDEDLQGATGLPHDMRLCAPVDQ